MAQAAICKYLDARFSASSASLQAQVKSINDVEVLDKIINKIYTVNNLKEAEVIVRDKAK